MLQVITIVWEGLEIIFSQSFAYEFSKGVSVDVHEEGNADFGVSTGNKAGSVVDFFLRGIQHPKGART